MPSLVEKWGTSSHHRSVQRLHEELGLERRKSALYFSKKDWSWIQTVRVVVTRHQIPYVYGRRVRKRAGPAQTQWQETYLWILGISSPHARLLYWTLIQNYLSKSSSPQAIVMSTDEDEEVVFPRGEPKTFSPLRMNIAKFIADEPVQTGLYLKFSQTWPSQLWQKEKVKSLDPEAKRESSTNLNRTASLPQQQTSNMWHHKKQSYTSYP